MTAEIRNLLRALLDGARQELDHAEEVLDGTRVEPCPTCRRWADAVAPVVDVLGADGDGAVTVDLQTRREIVQRLLALTAELKETCDG